MNGQEENVCQCGFAHQPARNARTHADRVRPPANKVGSKSISTPVPVHPIIEADATLDELVMNAPDNISAPFEVPVFVQERCDHWGSSLRFMEGFTTSSVLDPQSLLQERQQSVATPQQLDNVLRPWRRY